MTYIETNQRTPAGLPLFAVGVTSLRPVARDLRTCRRPGPDGYDLGMEQPVVGLVVHPTKNVQESIATLQGWNASGLGRLVARRADAQRIGGDVEVIGDDDFTDQVDLVVALGGDGTMLGAMRLVAKRPVPVLGVNYGNVGFLVEIEPPELEAALDRLSAGEYQLEPHHALEARLSWGGARGRTTWRSTT